ncbi:MAG: serpin family protein [Planctomycetes bacterium]|nr:serpin family protein [Planctomycetota bacterium]
MPTLKLLAPLSAAILLLASCAATVAEDKPAKGSGDPKVLAARNNQFGFELMGKLHKEGENIFISPVSISTALQMTAGGAQGETRDEMAKAMHVDDLKLAEHNKALLDALNSRKDFKLSVANSLWSDKARVTLKEEFVKECRDFFSAEVRTLNFSDKATVKVINDWISDKTNQKITNMLDAIPADAISYLVNAVHFKGGWSHEFSKDATKEGDFTLNDGTKKKLPLMTQWEDSPYNESADWQAVGLLFGEERQAVMWFILPAKGKKLSDLMAKLDAETFAKMTKPNYNSGTITIPRFKVHYKAGLVDALKALGMKKCFADADFTRFGSSTMGRIFIGRVLHEAVLEVNEQGAEAAAATIVEMKAESAPANPFTFKADRPFAVAIVDRGSGSVLFAGAIYDPEKLEK